MLQRNIPGVVLVLGAALLLLITRQPVPALAGFTPTPPPPPEATVVPTNAPPPNKEPKPTPTPTLSLTATPGTLPVAGGEAHDETGSEVMLLALAGILILGAMGIGMGAITRRTGGPRSE
jgi:hypothetical protein